MYNIPFSIQQKIQKYETIEMDGLQLYPITVRNYYEYLAAKPAIEVIQQALPARYISLPLLQAFLTMDIDARENGQETTGLLYRCLLFLALSLRLGEGKKAEDRVKLFRIILDPKDPTKLKSLRFVVNGEETQEITPVSFQRLRPILAAQNGIELISENANPDLIEAERDIASLKSPPLDAKVEHLISAAAIVAKAEESEIYNWPILKLQKRTQSFKKILDFVVCSIGEMQGATWKGGNPHPHPFFDRVSESSAALMPIQEFAGGEGLKAIQNANANKN